MSILLARTSTQVASLKLKVAKFYVSWRRWHYCYEYDTVFILYARQNIASADMLIKNIVSADIFIKKQSYVSVNAHLHVYVFSCYFLRFTCVCIVRVVRVVCK